MSDSAERAPAAVSRAIREFVEDVRELLTFYIDADQAFAALLKRVATAIDESPKGRATPLAYTDGPPRAGTPILSRSALGDMADRLSRKGANATLMARYVLVLIYHLWEVNHRARIAEAAGRPTNEIKSAVIGDLRHLRIDALHHGGVVREESAQRLEVLKRFVRPGHPIELDGRAVQEIVQEVYRGMDAPEEELTGGSVGHARTIELPPVAKVWKSRA